MSHCQSPFELVIKMSGDGLIMLIEIRYCTSVS